MTKISLWALIYCVCSMIGFTVSVPLKKKTLDDALEFVRRERMRRSAELATPEELPNEEENLNMSALDLDKYLQNIIDSEPYDEDSASSNVDEEPVIEYDDNSLKKKRGMVDSNRKDVIDSDVAKEFIKEFIDLEEDENTNLAKALNLATFAQLDKSEEYIENEAKFIKNAIEDEEQILAFKKSLNGALHDLFKNEDVLKRNSDEKLAYGPMLIQERKRSEDKMTAHQMKDSRFDDFIDALKEAELDEANEDELQDEIDEEILSIVKEKLKQYIIKKLSKSYDRTPGYNTQMLGPNSLTSDEEADTNEYMLNPFLRELKQRLFSNGVAKRSSMIEDESPQNMNYGLSLLQNQIQDEQKSDIDEDEEAMLTCPVLNILDNCLVADKLELKIDSDVKELCNQHHLCYLCGSVIELSQDDCDKKYLVEADTQCEYEENTEQCKERAIDFFGVLRTDHSFSTLENAHNSCWHDCSINWILNYNGQ